jgi:hypothetical protein
MSRFKSLFITSKSVGEFININVETTSGYWGYSHFGRYYGPFENGVETIEVEVNPIDV